MNNIHTGPHSRENAVKIPFGGLVEPAAFAGESIYTGFAMIARGIFRVVEACREWRQVNNIVNILSSLDDHVLRDIGIPRGEIRAAARHCIAFPDVDCRAWFRQHE